MSPVTPLRLNSAVIVLGIMVILLSASLVSVVSFGLFEKPASAEPLPEDFFLGVTADGNVTETKLLIDKVKDYTNMIAFTNLAVTENLTRLEEVTDYAYGNGLSFLVFTVYPSPFAKNFTYNPITWGSEAKNKYGEKFLGFYIWDEPGGNQLDRGGFRQFDNTTMPYDYRDAANTYVYYLYLQMRDFIKNQLFTSDYGLYWYDYEAGYDVVLCEFGWNLSRPLNIALCRGAAEMHNKTWGAMITWTYENPPYIEAPSELYQDMVTAYDAGAKYVVVYNYPQTGPYGLLGEEHFSAIEDFRNYVLANPQNKSSNVEKVAYVVPDNYGWGFRNPQDTIWGVWEADENSQVIWEEVNSLVQTYGDNFDILIGSPWTQVFGGYHYDTLIWWNGTIIGTG
ncbi:MAG: hypothetical protein NWF00_08005 [Candidatus Bathyarchaeota archaeon]|nr:hypothetical protein [Candidatus Bathyarchaeota archaeon]